MTFNELYQIQFPLELLIDNNIFKLSLCIWKKNGDVKTLSSLEIQTANNCRDTSHISISMKSPIIFKQK